MSSVSFWPGVSNFIDEVENLQVIRIEQGCHKPGVSSKECRIDFARATLSIERVSERLACKKACLLPSHAIEGKIGGGHNTNTR